MLCIRNGTWLIALSSIFLFLTACSYSYYQPVFNIGLISVDLERDTNNYIEPANIYNEQKLSGSIISNHHFDCEQFRVIWDLDEAQIQLEIINHTDEEIAIIWNSAYYEDANRDKHKVAPRAAIHANERTTDSVVLPKASSKIIIQPVDYIHYVEGNSGDYREKTLFKSSPSFSDKLNRTTKKNIGRIVKLLLPVKTQDIIRKYIFTFKVISIENEKRQCASLDC